MTGPVLAALLASLAAEQATPRPLAPGRWVGRVTVEGGLQAFSILNVPPSGSMAVLALPLEGKTYALAISVRENLILLESAEHTGMRLEGQLTQGVLVGRNRSRTFELRHIPAAKPEALEAVTGFYRTPDRKLLFLSPWAPLGIPLLLSQDDAGRIAAAYPLENHEFVVGAGAFALFPEGSRFRVLTGAEGVPVGLRWREGEREWESARAPLYDEQPAEFENGEVKLGGMLLVPRTPPPHPAVVLVHGSGPHDRYDMLVHASFLLRAGVALLAYDKRGARASGGDWQTATVSDLAGDAAAGARWLRQRADIHPGQIGLLGLSEGGWVAPLAASRSPEVSFVVTFAGPAVTPVELDLANMRQALEGQAIPDHEIQQALALKRLSDAFAETGQGWEAFIAGHERAAGRPWQALFGYVGTPPSRDSWYWRYWRGMMAYDPLPVLRRLRTPVLAILGEFDSVVRPETNAPLWRAALQDAGNEQARVVVVARAAHPLFEVERGGARELATATRFPAALESTVLEWLGPRVRLVR